MVSYPENIRLLSWCSGGDSAALLRPAMLEVNLCACTWRSNRRVRIRYANYQIKNPPYGRLFIWYTGRDGRFATLCDTCSSAVADCACTLQSNPGLRIRYANYQLKNPPAVGSQVGTTYPMYYEQSIT